MGQFGFFVEVEDLRYFFVPAEELYLHPIYVYELRWACTDHTGTENVGGPSTKLSRSVDNGLALYEDNKRPIPVLIECFNAPNRPLPNEVSGLHPLVSEPYPANYS